MERALQDARAAGFEPCLMVGFNRRFSPHARAVQAAFRDRGTPMVVNYRVNADVIPPESWLHDPEEGGGRIIGEGCHFVDFCTALIGSDPVAVMANSIASDSRDVVPHDSAVIAVQYADGSLATIQYLALGHRSPWPKNGARSSRTGGAPSWTTFAPPGSTAEGGGCTASRPKGSPRRSMRS